MLFPRDVSAKASGMGELTTEVSSKFGVASTRGAVSYAEALRPCVAAFSSAVLLSLRFPNRDWHPDPRDGDEILEARYVRHGSETAGPGTGILAGCPVAVSSAGAYLFDACNTMLQEHPRVPCGKLSATSACAPHLSTRWLQHRWLQKL